MVIQVERPLLRGHDVPDGTAVVLALTIRLEVGARLRDAIKGRAELHPVARIAEFERALTTMRRPLVGAIVEARDADDRDVAPLVRGLRARLPQLPIVGYCRLGGEMSGLVRALAASGVHELMFEGYDDHGLALRSILDHAMQACTADAVFASLGGLIPTSLRPFAVFCLRYPEQSHSVARIAAGLGVHRRTLANYCARNALVSPAELLSWCRLALAAYYLGTTHATVEAIALRLDFSSATAMRNMFKRYTGLRALEVRRRGGVCCVVEALVQALDQRRGGAAIPRTPLATSAETT